MGFVIDKYLPSVERNRKQFYLDSAADLPTIYDKKSIARSSVAIDIATGRKWILNSKWQWQEYCAGDVDPAAILSGYSSSIYKALNGKSYVDGADYATDIADTIEGIIPDDVSYSVALVYLELPTAGTSTNTKGTNGSYTFSVTLTTDEATDTGSNITVTLEAAAYIADLSSYTAAIFKALDGVGYAATDDYAAEISATVEAILPSSLTYTVTQVSLTPAVDGTKYDEEGTDGSYVYYVSVSNGEITERTDDITATLYAALYVEDLSPYSDYLSYALNNKVYAAGVDYMTEINTVITNYLPTGISYKINTISLVPAVDGTLDNRNGTEGTFIYNITLSGANGATDTGDTITCTMRATAFVLDLEGYLASIHTALNGKEYASNESYATNISATIASIVPSDVTYTVNEISLTAPIDGTAADPAGTEGVYIFTVTLVGGGDTATGGPVTVILDPKEYIADLTSYAEDIYNTLNSKSYAYDADYAADIDSVIEGIIPDGTVYEITDIVTMPATAGTADDIDGSDGFYVFRVTLSFGDASQSITENITVVLEAQHYAEDLTPYSDAIYAALNGVSFASSVNYVAAIDGTIYSIVPSNVEYTVTTVTLVDKVDGDPDGETTEELTGTPGSYTFYVSLAGEYGAADTGDNITTTLEQLTYAPEDLQPYADSIYAALNGKVYESGADHEADVLDVISKIVPTRITATVTGAVTVDAVDGTYSDPTGSAGSYTFTVSLTDTFEETEDVSTDEIVTVLQQVELPEEDLTPYIEGLQTAFIDAYFTNDTYEAGVNEIIADVLPEDGHITYEITTRELNLAVDGTMSNPAGEYGDYTFMVTLTGPIGETANTPDLFVDLIQTVLSTEDLQSYIDDIYAALDGKVYEYEDAENVVADVDAIITAILAEGGYPHTYAQLTYAAPVAGTIDDNAGTPGTYSFIVVVDGRAATNLIVCTINTVEYVPEDLSEWVEVVENNIGAMTGIESGVDPVAAIQSVASGSISSRLTATVTVISRIDAIDGNIYDLDGTDGVIVTQVTISNEVGDSATTSIMITTLFAQELDGYYYWSGDAIPKLILAPEFKTALEGGTSFVDWRAGDPMPAPPAITVEKASWEGLFAGLTMSSIDMTNFGYADALRIVSCEGMFKGCTATEITFGDFWIDNCLTLKEMFANCTNLKSIDLDSFALTSCTSMESMFEGCTKLTNVTFSGNYIPDFYEVSDDATPVVSLSTMAATALDMDVNFAGYDTETGVLPEPPYDTSVDYSWAGMFKGIIVDKLDCSSFTTAGGYVTSCESMFEDCTAEEILFNNIVLGKCASFEKMFCNCTNLKKMKLDKVSNSCIKFISMFEGCASLNAVDLFAATGVSDTTVYLGYMFAYCTSIKAVSLNYIKGTFNAAYSFYGCSLLETVHFGVYSKSCASTVKTFYGASPSIMCSTADTYYSIYQSAYAFDSRDYNVYYLGNYYYVYSDASKCTASTGIDEYYFSVAFPMTRNMSGMFAYEDYVNLDLSKWDTSIATDFSQLFYQMSYLETINVSTWDTSNVTDMHQLFTPSTGSTYGPLKNLDVSNWDVSSVVDFSYAFSQLEMLETIDVSKWKPSSALYLDYMFYKNSSLKELDLSNWDMSNITYARYLFQDCFSLETVGDVSGWDISSLQYMNSMFYRCNSLEVLDVSKWDVSNVISMHALFYNTSIKVLDVTNWKTPALENMYHMFASNSNLTSLDLSGWDVSKVTGWTGLRYAFRDCINLTSLNVSTWETANCLYLDGTFQGLINLESLDLTSWTINSSALLDDMFEYGEYEITCTQAAYNKFSNASVCENGSVTYNVIDAT